MYRKIIESLYRKPVIKQPQSPPPLPPLPVLTPLPDMVKKALPSLKVNIPMKPSSSYFRRASSTLSPLSPLPPASGISHGSPRIGLVHKSLISRVQPSGLCNSPKLHRSQSMSSQPSVSTISPKTHSPLFRSIRPTSENRETVAPSTSTVLAPSTSFYTTMREMSNRGVPLMNQHGIIYSGLCNIKVIYVNITINYTSGRMVASRDPLLLVTRRGSLVFASPQTPSDNTAAEHTDTVCISNTIVT